MDYALKQQALNLGVKIIYDKNISFPVQIDSSGAKKAAAFAYGITFDTDAADIVSAIVDDRLAPKGYAYFIALNGRATLVSAFFAKPFKDPKKYYLETLSRYKNLLDFKIDNPREFAKYISFSLAKQRDAVIVGEAAGIQDYLFGFGMRLAVKSAELAAISIMEDKSYHRLYRAHILPFLRAGLVNRFIFERLGNNGYKRQLKKANTVPDVRKFLGRSYHFSPAHRLFYPIARLKYRGLWD
ncbi:MAG TPA: hypothetical protein ENH19_01580 [Actinobacteria bacterium]|nr:hypothetical protein [Actinomycetes bacterium]HEX21328.1 hypothetical protein [Actinomycetota bacterium]